jgi:hypothetical protein
MRGRPLSYEVRWLAEPRIVLIRVWDELKLYEIREGSLKVLALFDAGIEPLYVVTDITAMTSHPLSVTDIILAGGFFRDERMSLLSVYGVRTPVVRLILTLLAQVGPFRLAITESLEDTLAVLAERDPSLVSVALASNPSLNNSLPR